MSEYMKVRGVRVNVEKYKRKLRKLYRQEGKQVRVTTRGPGPRAVHAATIRLVEPKGRQVYPTLAYDPDCGADLVGEYESGMAVTCQRCRKVSRGWG